MMKKLGLIVLIIGFHGGLWAQNPKFDRLEMWFAQGHYKKVYRKANNLLDNPEYDFSLLPSYYKSISLIQLSQNEHWLIRHPNALDEAFSLFMEIRRNGESQKLFEAHQYELVWLKDDMLAWAADFNRLGLEKEFSKLQGMIDQMFDGFELIDSAPDEVFEMDSSLVGTDYVGLRSEIVAIARKHLGVPYVWAGNTPDGFDCSGFTCYVLQQKGKQLPRRAEEQYRESVKVKAKNAQAGDLVFFDNGSGISHVGIVISGRGEPLVMIHSSSSKGIIITNVAESEYWSKRLYGFGTFVN